MREFLRGMLLAGVVCALAGCKNLPPPMPLEQLNAQQLRGHEVFTAQCARCHYDRRNGGLHGPSLLGIYKEPSLPSGAAATDERVTATIQLGRGMMPAMRGKLDAQDLDDLLAYLHTL